MKLSYDLKRGKALQAEEEVQVEQNKRRKIGEALKGNFDSLATKKKQLTNT